MSGTAISDSGSGGVPSTKRTRGSRSARFASTGSRWSTAQPGDALPEGERLVGEHLVCVVAAGEDAPELAGRLVGLVEREVVVRDQLADRVRDPLEQGVERLLGEHVVEDVGEPAVRLDEREGCRRRRRHRRGPETSWPQRCWCGGFTIASVTHRRGAEPA